MGQFSAEKPGMPGSVLSGNQHTTLNGIEPDNSRCVDVRMVKERGCCDVVAKPAAADTDVRLGAGQKPRGAGFAARLVLGRDQDDPANRSEREAARDALRRVFARSPLGKMGDADYGRSCRFREINHGLQSVARLGVIVTVCLAANRRNDYAFRSRARLRGEILPLSVPGGSASGMTPGLSTMARSELSPSPPASRRIS